LADCISDTDTTTQELLVEQIFPQQAEVLTTGKLDRALASRVVANDIRVDVG